MKKSKDQAPLIVEQHPQGYNGYPFVTLIGYNKETMLTIINNYNIKSGTIDAYVLDLCGPQRVNEEAIIALADMWFSKGNNKHPISIEFSRLGVTETTSRILKTFDIEHITRVIGPTPTFDMDPTRNARRRKRKELPKNVRVHPIG